jgi:hypothetical protein
MTSRTVGYKSCTCVMMLERLAPGFIPKSDEHSLVMLDTIEKTIWGLHGSWVHKLLNQLIVEVMGKAPALATSLRMGRSPAPLKHWASVEAATLSMVDMHSIEAVTALEL